MLNVKGAVSYEIISWENFNHYAFNGKSYYKTLITLGLKIFYIKDGQNKYWDGGEDL